MKKDQTGGAALAFGFIVLLALVGVGSYYLGMQKSQVPMPIEGKGQPDTFIDSPSTSIAPIPTGVIEKATLPSGWTYSKSSPCNVLIPLPPKEEPYFIPDNPNTPPSVDDEGGWWQLEERGSDNPTDQFFTGQVIAIFRNPNAMGSGYVPGLVQIFCGPNRENYTTQGFVTDYGKQYTDGTFEGLDFSNQGEINLWGKKVNRASITGGMYSEDDLEYFFATPESLFQVRKVSLSKLQIIKDATEKIFENLQFP